MERYRVAGHIVHAPDWPVDLGIGLVAATDHFDAFVRGLPDPPIIVGHATGGRIPQSARTRTGAGGGRHPPPKPRGVLRLLRRCGFRRGRGFATLTVAMRSRSALRSSTTHSQTRSRGPIRSVARRNRAPGARRPIFESAMADFMPKSKAATLIDFAKPDRAPLLLVAGDRDHVTPSSVVYENFNRYRRSSAATDFQLFRGSRTALPPLPAGPTWPTTLDLDDGHTHSLATWPDCVPVGWLRSARRSWRSPHGSG